MTLTRLRLDITAKNSLIDAICKTINNNILAGKTTRDVPLQLQQTIELSATHPYTMRISNAAGTKLHEVEDLESCSVAMQRAAAFFNDESRKLDSHSYAVIVDAGIPTVKPTDNNAWVNLGQVTPGGLVLNENGDVFVRLAGAVGGSPEQVYWAATADGVVKTVTKFTKVLPLS